MGAHLMTALAAPAFGLIFGLLLLFWGWRGKRIDDHPICRRCGFDLFGLPPDSHRCSECGRDLTLPKSTWTGNRRKQPWFVTTGLALFLSMSGWLVTAGSQAVANVQAQMKPVWWLMMDTRSTTPATAFTATNELFHRWESGKLSESQTNALIDRVLDFQVDPKRPWEFSEWTKIIKDTHARGRLTDARWQRYWRQMYTIQLQVRSKVRRGEPIPLAVFRTDMGWGTDLSAVQLWIVSLSIDSNACEPPQTRGGWRDVPDSAIQDRHPPEGLAELSPQLLSRLNDGQHKISAVVELVIRDGFDRFSNIKETVRIHVPVEGKFDVVPADAPTVKLKSPPAHRQAVNASVTVKDISMTYGWPVRNAVIARFFVQAGKAPVPISADVYLRNGKREWPAGSIVAGNESSMSRLGFDSSEIQCEIRVDDFIGDRADVILRPNVEHAMKTLNLTEVWGEEIIMKDIWATEWFDHRDESPEMLRGRFMMALKGEKSEENWRKRTEYFEGLAQFKDEEALILIKDGLLNDPSTECRQEILKQLRATGEVTRVIDTLLELLRGKGSPHRPLSEKPPQPWPESVREYLSWARSLKDLDAATSQKVDEAIRMLDARG